MKRTLSCLAAITLVLQLYAPPPADACGVKLIVKSNGPRKPARKPIKAEESRPVIAARPAREPIAVGPPKQPDRRTVAAKPKEQPATPPAPTPPPAAATTPAPTPRPATPPAETPPAPTVVAAKEPRETQPTPTPPPNPKPAPPPVAPITQQELYFGNNSATVTNAAALNRIARWMKSDPTVSVTIEGHADPRGTPDGNMTLSETRAKRVRDHLVGAGIDASRLHVEAFGDTRLQYAKTDGRNRRVVISPK